LIPMSKDKAATAYYGLRIAMALMVVGSGSFGIGWLLGSSVLVDPGQRAVYVSGGHYQTTVGEGFHPGIPFIDRYRVFDMRQNVIRVNNAEAVTRDDINVQNLNITVRWNIRDGQNLGELYQETAVSQDRLREKVVRPAVQDVPRTCAAQFTITEVVSTDIDGYRECVRDRLTDRLNDDGLVIIDVSIENKDYPASLQQKFQQQREAREQERIAQIELNVTETESQEEVIEARSRARSIRIITGNITDQYIAYDRVQALRNANSVWVVPEGSNPDVVPEVTNATGD